MKRVIFILTFALISFISSQSAVATESIVSTMEAAHGAKAWDANSALRTDLTLFFGGKRRIDGSMVMNTAASKSRITDKNGAVIVFDGQSAWVAPADSSFKKPRFEALTWPYFLAAQFKFDDPGVHVEPKGVKKLEGKMYQTAKVTFDSGVGDSPDDWYLVYQDLETKALKAMAYIVTYGVGEKGKTKEPHAIVYDDFQTFDGVTLATDWKFYKWSDEQGVFGEPIGKATLSNISFVEPDAKVFTKPAGAVEDKLPAAK